MARKTVAGAHWLEGPAADSYLRMIAAGCPGGITSAGRDSKQQEQLFLARYTPQATGSGPYGDVRTWKGIRYVRVSAAGPVAVPGSSRHEAGTALDLPEPARSWVTRHGAPFGWIAGRVKGEPWHMEYDAARDTKAPKAANDNFPLKKGSHGPRVGKLQRGLRAQVPGLAKWVKVKPDQLITDDDAFGDQTDAWTIAFQTLVGIEPDGIVGPITTGKLAEHGIRLT